MISPLQDRITIAEQVKGKRNAVALSVRSTGGSEDNLTHPIDGSVARYFICNNRLRGVS